MPLYRNFSRTVCEIAHVEGHAHGGWLAALALSLDPQCADKLDPALLKRISASLLQQPGALRCQWLRQAGERSPPTSSMETTLRGRPDSQVDVAILVDVNFRHQAYEALVGLEALLKDSAVACAPLQRGCYQQVFAA